jgi:ribonuclease P protein component
MERLKTRSEYLQVARGGRTPRRGFLLQSMPRGPAADPVDGAGGAETPPARFGFTVTKKIGNAVVRNRIRRRLKEAVRLEGALAAKPGTDYVLVGRRPALDQPFDELVADVVGALKAAAKGAAPSTAKAPRQDARKRPDHG